MHDDDDPIPRLDSQLCFAIHAASRAMTRAYRPSLDALGVTYTQYVTLMVLWEEDGLGVGELGERMRLDSGTLTPLLKRLERDGLVTRQRGPDDERRVRVHLTQAGRDMSAHAPRIQRELLCKLTDSAEDLSGLREQLVALVAALDAS